MNGIYYLCHFLGIVAAIGYMALIAPTFKLQRVRAVLCVSCALAAGYLLMRFLYFIVVGDWAAQNTVRLVAFVPLLALLFAWLFKLPVVRFMDAAAPVICIAHGIGKIGCQFVGCCHSFWEVDWGIYNRLTNTILFPIQLTESLVALLIAGLLIGIIVHKKGKTDGWLMPIMLVLFGLTRFFLEFLRESKKVLWNLSEFALWSILIFIVGSIWLVVKKVMRYINKKANKSPFCGN